MVLCAYMCESVRAFWYRINWNGFLRWCACEILPISIFTDTSLQSGSSSFNDEEMKIEKFSRNYFIHSRVHMHALWLLCRGHTVHRKRYFWTHSYILGMSCWCQHILNSFGIRFGFTSSCILGLFSNWNCFRFLLKFSLFMAPPPNFLGVSTEYYPSPTKLSNFTEYESSTHMY